MNLLTVLSIIARAFLMMFAYERVMGIFFEKRRTSFLLTAASYFFGSALTSFRYIFITNAIFGTLFSLATLFIITLNYDSPMIKRFAAICGTHLLAMLVFFLITGLTMGAVALVPAVSSFPYWFDTAEWFMILLGPILYLIASLFRRIFKNIKRITIEPSVLWLSFPSLWLSAAFLLVCFPLPYSIPISAWILIVFFYFLSSCMSFFLHDTLATSYENNVKSALHSQESKYYFAQCQQMQESVESIKSVRHDMKNHLTVLRNYAVKRKKSEIINYINRLLDDIA